MKKYKVVKNEQLYQVCFYMCIIANIVYFIAVPFQISGLNSLSARILIVCPTFCGILYLINKIKYSNILSTLGLMVIIASIISLVLGVKSDFFSQIVQLITFLTLPLSLMFYRSLVDITKLKNIIYKGYILIAFIYVFLSFTSLSHIGYTQWGVYYGPLTLGYSNPNETAMYLLICVTILISSLFNNKINKFKLITILLILYLCFLIIQTESRAIIALLPISILLYLIFKKLRYNNNLVVKLLFEVIMLSPIIYFLIVFVTSSLAIEISFLGDSLSTGREFIYYSYLDQLNFTTFFFGNFQQFKFQNLHNSYITILATLGLLGFLPYYILIKKIFFQIYLKANEKSQIYIFCVLLVIIIHGTVEAALLVSGVIYASSISMIYILGMQDIKLKNDGINK